MNGSIENNRKYTFTPLIFFGRRYSVTSRQSAIISLTTVLCVFSQYIGVSYYVDLCYELCLGQGALFFWAFWVIESIKNQFLLFIFGINRK
jgi:hypothetical protein